MAISFDFAHGRKHPIRQGEELRIFSFTLMEIFANYGVIEVSALSQGFCSHWARRNPAERCGGL
jgi:hypothetical protein